MNENSQSQSMKCLLEVAELRTEDLLEEQIWESVPCQDSGASSLADDMPRLLRRAGLCMCEEFMVRWVRTGQVYNIYRSLKTSLHTPSLRGLDFSAPPVVPESINSSVEVNMTGNKTPCLSQ